MITVFPSFRPNAAGILRPICLWSQQFYREMPGQFNLLCTSVKREWPRKRETNGSNDYLRSHKENSMNDVRCPSLVSHL